MAQLNPEQWAEVDRLFERAYEMPPQERPGFLARECPAEDVRREVASLLEHAGAGIPNADAAIAAAAAELAGETDPDERLIGTRLGPYKVEAIAGHGGMGAVYRASRDDAEFRQQVAIKLVRAAAESPSTLRRFKQERQILAQLSHPNIARLLDGGSTAEGVPYLVMEFIEGEPITAWCDRHALNVQERLRIFLQVCEGVAFAHRNLVVHRDLKPANILVTKEGAPKLLDFGIAKLLEPAAENQAVTLTGMHMMSPDYAAPEQVRGETVSTASDVYSLGLILYEIMTGHKAQQLTGHSPATIANVVCGAEPTAPATLKPQLSGDLDNIIRMAIRKEPERRYGSVADLARDIQCHLDGRPVAARGDTLSYRTARLLRRHRRKVVAGAVMAASLCAGLVLAYWLGEPTRRPRVLQVMQLTRTGRVEGALGLATDGAQIYFTERTGGRWSLAKVSVGGGTPLPVEFPEWLFQPNILDISPDRSRLLVCGGQASGSDRPLWMVPTTGGAPRRIGDVLGSAGTWSRDGSRIIFARGAAFFQIANDGTDCRKLVDTPGAATSIRHGPPPEPDLLRFAVLNPAGSYSLWEALSDGTRLHPLLRWWGPGAAYPDADDNGDWMAAGRYFVFRSRRGSAVSVWAMREPRGLLPGFNRRPVQIYSPPLELMAMAPHPDGKQLFFSAGQERRELVRYDAARGQFMPFLPGIAGRWVDFSKDGKWVVYTTFLQGDLWRSRPDGSEPMRLSSTSGIHQPRWSPEGTRITFSRSGKVCVISSGGGDLQVITPGSFQEGEPSWSPGGQSLLFQRISPQPGIYVIDLKTRKTELLPSSEPFLRPAWSPDSRYVAANRAGTEIHLFDFRTRQWTLMATGQGLGVPFWSRDSKFIYYQEGFGGTEQPIYRVRISSRKIERMMSSRQIPQSNLTGYLLTGLAPDDAPVATVLRSNSDLYALELDLP